VGVVVDQQHLCMVVEEVAQMLLQTLDLVVVLGQVQELRVMVVQV
jgi:hypothetical protein